MRPGAALCGALALLLLPRVVPAQAPAALPRAEPRPAAERRTPVVAAAERSRGAVVNVSAEEMVRVRVPAPGADMGQLLFEEFFGKPRFRSGYAVTSLGSGVIVSPDGHVLTNAHVVERGARFRVQLLDGRELPARVLGTDPASDLAVLRVETKEKLPFLAAGRSDDLMIGETVIAIGNPFGLAHTVTTGVVSALHRKVGDPRRQLFDMVQTDASINPGQLGRTAGEHPGAAHRGEHGHHRRPQRRHRLRHPHRPGPAGGRGPDPARRGAGGVQRHRRPGRAGEVRPDRRRPGAGPGERGGGRGRRPRPPASGRATWWNRWGTLRWRAPPSTASGVRDVPVGGSVRLWLLRGKERIQASIRTIALSAERAEQQLLQRTGLTLGEEKVRGGSVVVVRSVRRGSPAADTGLQAGDWIREVNSLEIGSLADWRKAAAQARQAGQLVLLVQRGFAAERVAFDVD